MMLLKFCTQYASKFGKFSSCTGPEKISSHSNSKKSSDKNVQTTYHTIVLISHANKLMLKILQARLQQYVNCELPDIQARYSKGRRTINQFANICWIIEKATEFQKNIYVCFIDSAKAFGCVDHDKLGQFFKRWDYQTIFPASWEICM